MPFFEQLDNGSWFQTQEVEIRHLAPSGHLFKKVHFGILRPLAYDPPNGTAEDRVTVQKGDETDLASVPAFLWGVVASYGQHTLSAIVHDHLYKEAKGKNSRRKRMEARREADELFVKAMAETEVPWAKRWVMWSAVRFGGAFAEFGGPIAPLLLALIGLQAAIPTLAIVLDQWGQLEPPVVLRWTVAIATPIVLSMNQWLRAALVWALLFIPVGVALLATLVALTVVWLPSFILWLLKNPRPLVACVVLYLLVFLLIDSLLARGILAALLPYGMVWLFPSTGEPPPIGPTGI